MCYTLFILGGRRTLDALSSLSIPVPSLSTLKREAKANILTYSQFGIKDVYFEAAKTFYSKCNYSGQFGLWFDVAFTTPRVDLWSSEKKIIGFVDFENDTLTFDFDILKQWTKTRTIANGMLIFLLIPLTDSISGESLSPFCVGILPSNGGYTADQLCIWLDEIFEKAKTHDIYITGINNNLLFILSLLIL